MDGQMNMVVNGQSYHQSVGDLLFIRPGMTHSCTGAGPEGSLIFPCISAYTIHPFAENLTVAKTSIIRQIRIWLWGSPLPCLPCMVWPQNICLARYLPPNK
ncbi:hypothetical protein MT997_21270 [Paenibacillus sp. OVF10]|nr:hypothetical protein MT997_21270 [Paenibacillus sp. OVF10]